MFVLCLANGQIEVAILWALFRSAKAKATKAAKEKEAKEAEEAKETKEAKEAKEAKEPKEPKETKTATNPRASLLRLALIWDRFDIAKAQVFGEVTSGFDAVVGESATNPVCLPFLQFLKQSYTYSLN